MDGVGNSRYGVWVGCSPFASSVAGRPQGGGRPVLIEAAAFSVHLQDVNAVSTAVQLGVGQPLRAEGLDPLVEGQVVEDQDRASLVTLAEDLEEKFGTGLGEWDEAELVDDEQLEPGQIHWEVEQSSLVPGLNHLVDQRGSRGEAGRQPPLARSESHTDSEMSSAGSAVADEDDVI